MLHVYALKNHTGYRRRKIQCKEYKNIEFIMGKTEDVLLNWNKDIDYLLLDPQDRMSQKRTRGCS